MFEFAWPWQFVLLPLPWLAARVLSPVRDSTGAALHLPYPLEGMQSATGAAPVVAWRRWVALVGWVLLVCAAARPQWLGPPQDVARTGRDLLLAVDASGSMQTPDMQIGGRAVSRYAAVKAIAGDFIRRRAGDRIGLIVFGSQAYMLTPLTFDRDSVLRQLDESAVGLPGRQTAIGDAIGLAIKRLQQRPRDQRVVILLTDGVNDAGALDPYKAIDLAVAEHVKIYTIGIGADAMTVGGFFGPRTVNPSADIDTRLLSQMAQETGGKFYRAHDTPELAHIYREIDALEPAADKGQPFRPVDEWFWWPLALAALLALALAGTALPLPQRLRERFAR
ncbi:MAG: VWA domain-containing protein [Proteobacteria bacterium]|nr:VWA domain-containing protein [Pseudomonadota bacterium]